MSLLPTQREAVRWIRGMGSDSDLLMWEGDVRSGKSHGAALALLIHSLNYTDQQFIVAGRTFGTVERNVIPKLLLAADMLTLPVKRVRSRGIMRIGANEFTLFGAPNVMAQDVVQGMDAAGVLIDEAALIDRDFVDQAITRTSVPGAKSILTFNPTYPSHWLKSEMLDVDPTIFHQRAKIVDAVEAGIIPRDYYERQLARLPAHKRKRWLEGIWAPAQGLIWPSLEVNAKAEPVPRYRRVEAGLDEGFSDAYAVVFAGQREDGVWQTCGEYYWDTGNRTVAEHIAAVLAIGRRLGCSRYWVDPAAAASKQELNRAGVQYSNARNAVIPGIDCVEAALKEERMLVTEDVPRLLNEAASYSWKDWDGDDMPDPAFADHACDAFRYLCMGRLRKVDLTPVAKPGAF